MIKSVLHPVTHERLIKGIDMYAEDANIPRVFIEQSSANNCTEDQLEWLKAYRTFPEKNINGLVLAGLGDPTMEMMAMVGALTRNFIRSRFLTMTMFLDHDQDPDLIEISCLFIANFYNHQSHSDDIAKWKLPTIYDLLLRRAAKGKQTVVHVSDMSKMRLFYGASISNHMQATYQAIEIKGNQ